ncbi:MAG: hypothetical protein Q7S21_07765 [archaeon]|nr:hypothetical protein [archaeon]
MGELSRSNEYSLKVSADQLSVKRAGDISKELAKKQLKKTAYSVGCIGSTIVLLFSLLITNLIIALEAMFVLGIFVMGLYKDWNEAEKFSKKEFVELAKKD